MKLTRSRRLDPIHTRSSTGPISHLYKELYQQPTPSVCVGPFKGTHIPCDGEKYFYKTENSRFYLSYLSTHTQSFVSQLLSSTQRRINYGKL